MILCPRTHLGPKRWHSASMQLKGKSSLWCSRVSLCLHYHLQCDSQIGSLIHHLWLPQGFSDSLLPNWWPMGFMCGLPWCGLHWYSRVGQHGAGGMGEYGPYSVVGGQGQHVCSPGLGPQATQKLDIPRVDHSSLFPFG